MKKQFWLSLVLLAGWLIPVWSTAAQEARLGEPSRFGIVEAYYRPEDARDLGAGWERIIFEWAQFQPNGPDDYQTEVVPEAWLDDARQNGREVVGLLKNTPLWASGTDKLGAPPTGLDLSVDDPENYWAAFVRRTVQYYGDKWNIHHWIIYNEPDLRPGEFAWYEFDGDVRDYFQMVKVACLAAKSVDPGAVIHLAGMAWWGDVKAGRSPYLRRFLEVASDDPGAYLNGFYFDVATVHVYFGADDVWDLVKDTQAILADYGLHYKPIWIDETNALPSLDPFALVHDPQFQVTLGQQADFIVQAAAMSLAADVQRFAVYRLYDDHFVPGKSEPWGLVRADGSRRPAFATYQTVIHTFGDTIEAHRFYSSRSDLVILEQPGRTIYVMWARRTDPVTFHVWATGPGETAVRMLVSGATGSITPVTVPDVENWWFVVRTPGAVADPQIGAVIVEGSPAILIIDGPPRAVWIEVRGIQWRLFSPTGE